MRPLGFPKGRKNVISISIAFCLAFLIRNENVMQNKKPFEIILHIWRVTSLQSWVAENHVTVKSLYMNVPFLTTLSTLKACNSPYMQYYFKRFFVLHPSEVIFSFLIKKSRQKAIEIETAFFIPLGIPRVAHWIISFMLHISAITSPTNLYLYQ